MSDSLVVDQAGMDVVAGKLLDAARALDAAGARSPGTPRAGDVTADMAAMLGHLTSLAGELALGVAGAGEAVNRARTRYAEQDAATGRDLRAIP